MSLLKGKMTIAILLMSSWTWIPFSAKAAHRQPFSRRIEKRSKISQSNPFRSQTSALLTSYLKSGPFLETPFITQDTFLDNKEIANFQVEYADSNRRYELEKKLGLTNYYSERNYFYRNSDLSKKIMTRIENKQTDDQMRKLKPTLTSMSQNKILAPVVVVGAVAYALYSGKNIVLLDKDTYELAGSAHALSQTARIQVRTPAYTTSLEFKTTAPSTRNPGVVFVGDPLSRRDEKILFNVSKPFLSLGLNTNFAYRSTSQLVSTTVSREIIPHVTLATDTYYPLSDSSSDIKDPGVAFRGMYGFRF